ncbi:MAG: beta strand repeat-containing protein, partial [Bacteroidota bacterium]
LQNGKIQVKTVLGNIQEWMPKVYQNINGKEVKVKAEYVLTKPSSTANGSTSSPMGRDGEGLLSFNVGTYNPNYPLIIDPWITYYGGNGLDFFPSVANDNLGNVLVTGETRSIIFPTSVGAFQIGYAGGNSDTFVLSLTSNGITRNFATYYGGTHGDKGYGICSDASYNVVFCGETKSIDFPCGSTVSNVVFQNTVVAGNNGFLVKLDQTGVSQFATYYNGQMTDVCTDALDNIIAYGSTSNAINIATVGAFKITPVGGDAFVVKFQNNGLRLWGTYFGGSKNENSSGICVDRNTNDIYFTGGTTSTDYTVTVGSHQPTFGGGLNNDSYLTKLSPTGSLLWSTYYGGAEEDRGYAVCTDFLGNVIIGGRTNTPTSAVIRTNGSSFAGGVGDAFIAKFNSVGTRQWGTYMGGSGGDYCTGLACDVNNNIVALGDTYSSNFLSGTSCAFQTSFAGIESNWVSTFSPTGSIICLSYLRNGIGTHNETGEYAGGSVSIFGCQSYIAGCSNCNLPVTTGAYQTVCGGNDDITIAQFDINSCGMPLTPSIMSNTIALTGCNCDGAVTLSLTANCKLPPFNYYYSNGAQTLNTAALSNSLTGLCAGVYGYTVTTSCDVVSGNFSIGGPTNTITVTSSVTPANCSSATGSVTINTVSAPANYTITEGAVIIANNVNVPYTITGVSVGNHVYQIKSSSGCTTSFSASVWTETVTVTPTTNLSCNPPNTATLSANSSNALATYTWSGPGIVSGMNSNTPVVNQAGIYTVGVTYGACITVSVVTVTQNTTVPISVSSNSLNCITLNSTLTAVSPGNVIVWNGGSLLNATNPATVNTIGSYTVTATNTVTGCSSKNIVSVSQNTTIPIFTFSLSPGKTYTLNCINSSFLIFASSTSGDPVWRHSGLSGNLTISSPGNYTATASNPFNGCSTTTVITVSQNTVVPNRGATRSNSITCANPTATLTGISSTPGATFSWTPLGLTTATVITSIAGNHTLTVTNPINGCKSTTVVTVLRSVTVPTITASVNRTLTCIDNSATLTAVSAGTPIVWNGGALVNAANPAIVNAPGTYIATASSGGTCQASVLVSIIQNITQPRVVSLASEIILTCLRGSFPIWQSFFDSEGGTSLWTGGGLVNAPITSTITVADNYTATITNAQTGCSTFSVFTVLSNSVTNVSATISNSLSCVNPTALLTGTSTTVGTNFYTWYPSGLTTNTLLVNAPGNYTLQVVNTNGCPLATTVITVSGTTNSLTLNPTITNATCGTGTVIVGITGGAPNYTITEGVSTVATGAASSYTITGVSVGSHTYVVSSSNSCDQTLVVTIMDLCALPVQLTKFSASCADRK